MVSKKYDIIIVGGGIVGLLAAYLHLLKKRKVLLIDKDLSYGGHLKSELLGNNYFDYGTHILAETNIPLLNEILFDSFTKRNSNISKKIDNAHFFYKNINEKSCYFDSSVLDSKTREKINNEILNSQLDPSKDNAKKYLIDKFGLTLYKVFFHPFLLKIFGCDPAELHYESALFFDLSRVLAFNKEVSEKLTKIPFFSDRLGHHDRLEVPRLKYYPKKGGVGKCADLLFEKLVNGGCEIRLGQDIKEILFDKSKINGFVLDDTKALSTKINWTVSPVIFAKMCKIVNKSKPPKFTNTVLVDFSFLKKINTKSCFANIYASNFLSTRITFYQNLSKTNNFSCTVEVVTPKVINEKLLQRKILNELIKMKFVDGNNKVLFSTVRKINAGFPIVTNAAKSSLDNLVLKMESKFSNLMFLGKMSGRKFFMDEVLEETFSRIYDK